MENTIEFLLLARAGEMAAHDGVAVHVIHIFGAANQLQAELLRERDRLIHAPAAPETAAAPEEVAEPAPIAEAPPKPVAEEPAAPEPEVAVEEAATEEPAVEDAAT